MMYKAKAKVQRQPNTKMATLCYRLSQPPRPQHPWQLTQVVFFKSLLCLFSPTGERLPITVRIQYSLVLASWFRALWQLWPHDHDEYSCRLGLSSLVTNTCTSMSTSLFQNQLFDLRRLGLWLHGSLIRQSFGIFTGPNHKRINWYSQSTFRKCNKLVWWNQSRRQSRRLRWMHCIIGWHHCFGFSQTQKIH